MYETDLEALEKKYEMHEFPLSIGLEPTNYCNLNCIMCGHGKLTRKKGNMDIRLYKKIIDEVAEVNPDTRIYLDFYGEPLTLKFKLYYMIDYAKKKGVNNVNFNSNGLLLDEEMAEMLLDSGINFVSFDCDGFSKEVYEKIRVGGNRDKFYKNVEYILQRKKEYEKLYPSRKLPIIEVKIIEMPENQAEVSQLVEYWQKKGAWVAKRRLISWGGINERAQFQPHSRIACGAGLGTCMITWDGKVPYCCCDVDASVILGDLNTDSILDIWQRRNEQYIKYHFSHEWDKLPLICQKCNDWQHMGEIRYDEKGNLIKKNYKDKGKVFAEKS